MSEIDIYAVVVKLIGPIRPMGSSEVDCIRLENIKKMTRLIDAMIADISSIAPDADSDMHSVALIGQHADDFLETILDDK